MARVTSLMGRLVTFLTRLYNMVSHNIDYGIYSYFPKRQDSLVSQVCYDAAACLRGIASRWRRLRFRGRRTEAIEGIGDRVMAGVGSWTARTLGSSVACWAGAGRASMISRTARPLSVIRQPPFVRSIRPWEKISRPGTRAANRFVRSAQSRPLVARIAISRLMSSMTANPSG